MAKKRIQLKVHHGDNVPGDEVSVDEAQAQSLVDEGFADFVKPPADPKK